MMIFVCPTCGEELPRDLRAVIPHTENHIIDAIKERHPEWAAPDGICVKCYEYYKKELRFT